MIELLTVQAARRLWS